MNKLIEDVYLTHEMRVIKREGKYFAETSTEYGDTSEEIDINKLSAISKQLSLMVFEHFNPDHNELNR